MSKLAGLLRGKKIYDNDPRLAEFQRNFEYVPVYDNSFTGALHTDKCDYCGRANQQGSECKSCGAPL